MQRLQSSKIPLSYWEVIGRVLRFLQVWSPMVQFFLPVSFYMMLSIKTVVLICRSSSKSLVQSHAKTVVKTRSLILIVMPWILYLWTVCHLVFLLSLLFFFFFSRNKKDETRIPRIPSYFLTVYLKLGPWREMAFTFSGLETQLVIFFHKKLNTLHKK